MTAPVYRDNQPGSRVKHGVHTTSLNHPSTVNGDENLIRYVVFCGYDYTREAGVAEFQKRNMSGLPPRFEFRSKQ